MDIVKCRYPHCKHGGIINKLDDKYILVGKSWYYHEDCYKLKKNSADKDDKTREDLKIFRELWVNNINKTVVYWNLNKMLNDFIDRGVSSERLLFTLRYVIEHKLKLNYPAGFHYYLDNDDIKKAFLDKKRKDALAKNGVARREDTGVPASDNTQKFNVPKRKTIADLFS